MSETNYIESNALLAIIREDEDGALEILSEMLPNELDSFRFSVTKLERLIWQLQNERKWNDHQARLLAEHTKAEDQ